MYKLDQPFLELMLGHQMKATTVKDGSHMNENE